VSDQQESASQQGDPTEGIQKHDIMQSDFGWQVPVEAVPVPSEGKVYHPSSTMNGRHVLEIKAMTAQEEDILTSRALIQQGTVIKTLLESCLIDKTVDVDELLLGDKNALMVSVRITGYGSSYGATVSCPECAKSSNQDFDLSSMEIKRLEIEPVTPGENRFEFRLPVTGKLVHFKFLTGYDDSEIVITADRRRKLMDSGVESLVTTRLSYQIIAVDNVTDRNKLSAFVRNMPAQDSRKLRNYISEHEPGVDMRAWMSCPHCNEDSRVALPLGSNFFWPTG